MTLPIGSGVGKIYKIYNKKTDDIYIGCTILTMKERYPSRQSFRPQVIKLANEIGWKCFRLKVIERYKYDIRADLLERERYWIKKLKPSLNLVR